jgi:type VI secretion system protein ImpF
VLSLQKIREAVLRDLNWLFGTSNLESVFDLGEYPEVRSSVINYGIPDLAGMTLTTVDAKGLERLLRKAILDFEPRILAKTLKVRIEAEHESMRPNALTLIIDGQLWAKPVPMSLYLKTEIDMDSAAVSISEVAR